MITLIVDGLAVIALWSIAARRLQKWHLSGPLTLVSCGIVTGYVVGDDFGSQLDTHLAERVVELVLAVLLFIDASEVHGGFLAGDRAVVVRLLAIGVPLSLVTCYLFGVALLPSMSWALLLAITCVVMPLDFASAPHLLKDRSLPAWVRHIVAVESGYNDGLFSPLFAFALVLVSEPERSETAWSAVQKAVPAILWAILVGIGLGAAAGVTLRWARGARWTSGSAIKVTLVVLPFLTYALAVKAGGNGFVAAFLAGIAFKLGWIGWRGRHPRIPHTEFTAVESIGTIMSLLMWFVFGAVAELVFKNGVPGSWILYSLLALTAARMIPVYIAMIGSHAGARDRTLLGLLGPRGTSSIVFGLLAYNAAREDDADLALAVTMLVVLGSLVLHGFAVPVALRRLGAAREEEPSSAAG